MDVLLNAESTDLDLSDVDDGVNDFDFSGGNVEEKKTVYKSFKV